MVRIHVNFFSSCAIRGPYLEKHRSVGPYLYRSRLALYSIVLIQFIFYPEIIEIYKAARLSNGVIEKSETITHKMG